RPGGARRALAALRQHRARRAHSDRGPRQPPALARGGDGGRLPSPLPHRQPRLRDGHGGRERDREDDPAQPRPPRELLVALDRGPEPRPLPPAPPPGPPPAPAAPPPPRSPPLGMAAESAGGGVRHRRRRGRAV